MDYLEEPHSEFDAKSVKGIQCASICNGSIWIPSYTLQKHGLCPASPNVVAIMCLLRGSSLSQGGGFYSERPSRTKLEEEPGLPASNFVLFSATRSGVLSPSAKL